ncbi:MFS transporter [Parachlamydia acanthamoebae]|jgi:FSR family fosmidomycin resistance protein-like MFS transporter|uniref:Major facilitator superfamily (MFS) profile domain-containing protein n=2 Tax=Parachlamydia acanthamoebae TaxID=83552 RepID=F8L2K0_PARAV|nr:MFS transporter [Parachlamydia acanthamoebae]EFB40300.1 hypothetical protein pah_c209o023 [Parachlamydia acanthamoebae str. Hall's coccus]CCB87521.1 putative uncharacterized protein [Parachlamydia acanthamoebae UV-7]
MTFATKKMHLYGTVGFLWLSHLLVDTMIGIWPIYKTIAHIDLAVAGFIAAACAFIGEGMQIFFGMLSDKGHRKILICFGLLCAASSLFFPHVEGPFFLFLLYLFTCLGSGAFHPAAASHIGMLTEHRKSLFIAIFASGGAIGLACSQLAFSHCYHAFDGNTAYLFLPMAALILLIAFFPFATSTALLAKNKHSVSWKGIQKFLSSRELVSLYFCQVCVSSIFWGIIFLLPDILTSRGHVEWICMGGGHFFFVFGGALMMIPSGYLADKYSAKAVILTAIIFGSSIFYTFYFTPLLPPVFILILLFFMGAAFGIINPISVSQGHRLMPSHPGLISAIMMGLAFCLSESIGPGGGGLLAEYFEEDAAAKALAVVGLLCVPAFLNALALSSRQEIAPEQTVECAS